MSEYKKQQEIQRILATTSCTKKIQEACLRTARQLINITQQFPYVLVGKCSQEDLNNVILYLEGEKEHITSDLLERFVEVASDCSLENLRRMHSSGYKLFDNYNTWFEESGKTCDAHNTPQSLGEFVTVFGTKYYGLCTALGSCP